MSPLAKTFIVINLVLSLVFFAAVSTSYLLTQDWKIAYEKLSRESTNTIRGLNGDIAQKTALATTLNADVKKINATLEAALSDIKSAKADLAQKNLELAEASKSVQAALKMETERQRTIQGAQGTIQSLERRLAETIESRKQAIERMDEAVARHNAIRLDLAKVQEELTTARAEYAELSQDFQRQEIETAAIAAGRDVTKAAPPIDGRVVAVGDKIVVLSVGSDDNVEAGHEFTVFRESSFVAKVKVFEVLPNMAGAHIVHTAKAIEQGDKASTRIH